jgi:hypothetical protein
MSSTAGGQLMSQRKYKREQPYDEHKYAQTSKKQEKEKAIS